MISNLFDWLGNLGGIGDCFEIRWDPGHRSGQLVRWIRVDFGQISPSFQRGTAH